MKTPIISPIQYSNNKHSNNSLQKKNVTFGYQLVLENGASNPRVSVKGCVLAHDYVTIFGKPVMKKFWEKPNKLFGVEGFLKDTAEPLKNNQEYIEKVAATADVEDFLKRRIREVDAQLKSNNLNPEEKTALTTKLEKLQTKLGLFQNLPEKEKKLTDMALLVPGTVENNKAVFIPNIKRVRLPEEIDPAKPNETSIRLTNVDLPKVVDEIKKQGNVKTAKKVKFVALKDLGATALAVFENFVSLPEYRKQVKDGFSMTVIHPGGGYGAVDINVKDVIVNGFKETQLSIKTNEIGRDYRHNILNPAKPERLGALGASVPSMMNNFAEKLGFSKEDIEIIKKTGVGEMTTSSQVRLNNANCSKAIDLLLQSGIYEQLGKGPDNTLLRVKAENMKKFNNATKYAIHSFANNIAVAANPKIAESSRLIVLSGPLAMGINESIKTNPELYEAKDLKTLIFQFIDKNTNKDETIEENKRRFDIVCDRRLSVKNNTKGGARAINGKVYTHKDRGQWLDAPLKQFLSGDKTLIERTVIRGRNAFRKATGKIKSAAKML